MPCGAATFTGCRDTQRQSVGAPAAGARCADAGSHALLSGQSTCCAWGGTAWHRCSSSAGICTREQRHNAWRSEPPAAWCSRPGAHSRADASVMCSSAPRFVSAAVPADEDPTAWHTRHDASQTSRRAQLNEYCQNPPEERARSTALRHGHGNMSWMRSGLNQQPPDAHRSYRLGIPASKADLSKVLIGLRCCRPGPHLENTRTPSSPQRQHQIRRGSSQPSASEGDAARSSGRRRAHTAARASPRRRRAITSCTSMTSPPTRSARCWRRPRRRGTRPPSSFKPRQHCRHSLPNPKFAQRINRPLSTSAAAPTLPRRRGLVVGAIWWSVLYVHHLRPSRARVSVLCRKMGSSPLRALPTSAAVSTTSCANAKRHPALSIARGLARLLGPV